MLTETNWFFSHNNFNAFQDQRYIGTFNWRTDRCSSSKNLKITKRRSNNVRTSAGLLLRPWTRAKWRFLPSSNPRVGWARGSESDSSINVGSGWPERPWILPSGEMTISAIGETEQDAPAPTWGRDIQATANSLPSPAQATNHALTISVSLGESLSCI